jgi:DNA-binding winged helix-turn-helix (wHTH) protein/Tfp pilus assembly protein PilF
VRFGGFELDVGTGELRSQGRVERLAPQPTAILSLLVRRPGELVTREEMAQAVWGAETFVDYDQSLNFCIRQLRTALDDRPEDPKYIETLRGRGYRFIAPVEAIPPVEEPVAPANGIPPPAAQQPTRRRGVVAAFAVLSLAAIAAVAVLPSAGKNHSRPPRVESRVQDAYLKGRHFWNMRTRESLERARQHFSEAVALDPNFAPAVAGLADSLMSLAGKDRPAFQEAAVIADRALTIDPRLAEAHVTRAHARLHMFDWPGAMTGFQHAIALDPDYVPGRYLYAEYYITQGRFEEATAEARRGAALDPVSAIATHVGGVAYFFARRYDEAIREFRKAAELDPVHPYSKMRLIHALVAAGDTAGAVAEQTGDGVKGWSDAYVAARIGHMDEAREIISGLGPDTDPYHAALAHLALGDRERTLDLLRQSATMGTYNAIYLGVDPRLQALRGDPRLSAIVEQVGLGPVEKRVWR